MRLNRNWFLMISIINNRCCINDNMYYFLLLVPDFQVLNQKKFIKTKCVSNFKFVKQNEQ